MMLALLLALAAGVATVASPCVLPLLPLILGLSAGTTPARGAVWRPVAIVAGFVLAFAGAALLLGVSAQVVGVSAAVLRSFAIGLLVLFGLALLWPNLWDQVMRSWGPLTSIAQRWGQGSGLGSAFVLGMSLGVVWTPCAGPVLASILALVAAQQHLADAFGLLMAYALGAGIPMFALAYGGQTALRRVSALARHTVTLRRVFGALVLLTAMAMQAQWDTALAASLTRWAQSFTPWGRTVSSDVASEGPLFPALAPEFVGLGPWFNTDKPLSMSQLRGRVVLIDFWTFSCVNCIHTLPHLQAWHERYGDQGLSVVGIHTPEFAYERNVDKVRAAIEHHGLGYAVAQDNRYETWTAWRNSAWPALYLVDRDGRVIFRHVGEGDYEHIEAEIGKALSR